MSFGRLGALGRGFGRLGGGGKSGPTLNLSASSYPANSALNTGVALKADLSNANANEAWVFW
jgi:hypothetical protein